MRSFVPSCRSTRPSPDQDPARLVKSADCALSEGADKLRAVAQAAPASAYTDSLFGGDCMVPHPVCLAVTLASALAGALVVTPTLEAMPQVTTLANYKSVIANTGAGWYSS